MQTVACFIVRALNERERRRDLAKEQARALYFLIAIVPICRVAFRHSAREIVKNDREKISRREMLYRNVCVITKGIKFITRPPINSRNISLTYSLSRFNLLRPDFGKKQIPINFFLIKITNCSICQWRMDKVFIKRLVNKMLFQLSTLLSRITICKITTITQCFIITS